MKTITSLNNQLSDPDLVIQDSTVIVVLFLVLMADILQDQAAVKAHAEGLQKLVLARGGIEAFRHDTKLYMKLSRCVISCSPPVRS